MPRVLEGHQSSQFLKRRFWPVSGVPTITQGLRGTRRRWGVLSRIDGVKWAGENLTKIAGVRRPEIMSLPDSLPWMESVDAKIVRAKEHLGTLHAEAGVFFEITKRNFILKSNGREAWIVHYVTTSRVPSRPFASASSWASASSTFGRRSITLFAA